MPYFINSERKHSPLKFVTQMAYRFGGKIVAVSQLNARKAEDLLVKLGIFTKDDFERRPVLSVTNGVDHQFWMAPELAKILKLDHADPNEWAPENVLDPKDPQNRRLVDYLRRGELYERWSADHAEPVISDVDLYHIVRREKKNAIHKIREIVRRQYIREESELIRVLRIKEGDDFSEPVIRRKLHALRVRWAHWNGVENPEMWVSRDRKSTRLNSSHSAKSRMPSSA